jgi:2-polyprenyl-3-methyl-5-hydroxy-6-metoxy-1,4-benzoquinol methylase
VTNLMNDAKNLWEEIAASEAYFGVSTFEKYRSAELDEATKREFFESGREHVDLIFRELEDAFGPIGRSTKALDYGCGVGRVLLPLAERCGSVVGVDISSRMIDEARKNLTAAGLGSFELRRSEDFLDADGGEFDLVHSYIVLQHIEPQIGYGIVEKILNSLKRGGIGMIHVTHTDNAPIFTRLRSRIYRDLHFIHKAIRRGNRPFIPMYSYDMSRITEIFERDGCSIRRSVPTDHGYLGEMLFFQKDS